MKDKHKREIEKLKIKEIERSHNPQGESDDLAQQMAADSININDIINIQNSGTKSNCINPNVDMNQTDDEDNNLGMNDLEEFDNDTTPFNFNPSDLQGLNTDYKNEHTDFDDPYQEGIRASYRSQTSQRDTFNSQIFQQEP